MIKPTSQQLKAGEIFFPHAFRKHMAIELDDTSRFVHYTTATAAMSILENKEIWMRNATCMNDYQEINYGLGCLDAVYDSETGEQFRECLDGIHEGFCKEIEGLFSGWRPTFPRQTYLWCLSQHLTEENEFGRLSMWRAYGHNTGVAIVLKTAPFLSPSNALKAYSSPVGYFTMDEFNLEFSIVVTELRDNIDFLRAMPREELTGYIFQMFKFAALCTKHPGFKEELEWRVVYTHELEPSSRLIKEITIIQGTPQTIYKIPLENVPDEGLMGIEIPEILDRVIIGPTDYPGAARDAFVHLLEEANVEDAASKVVVSDIPIR